MINRLPISFIIPCHNEEENIGSLLDSVNSQKYRPAEVIVPNWSEDNTEAIALSKGAKVVEGGTLSVGRNKGAAVSKQDLFFFSDGDNTITPSTFLKEAYDEFIKSGADIASTMFRLDDESRRYPMAIFTFKVYSWLKRLSSKMRRPFVESGFFLIARREAFEAVGGFRRMENGLPEDLDFMTRAMNAGYKYKVLKIKVTTSGRRYFRFNKAIRAIVGTTLCGIVVKNGWYDKPKVVGLATGLYGNLGGKGKNDTAKKVLAGGLILAATIAAFKLLNDRSKNLNYKMKTKIHDKWRTK